MNQREIQELMRNLFYRNEEGVVSIAPQAWVLAPFAAIREKYQENNIADVELTIVWYAADYRSDFLDSRPIPERCEDIKRKVYPYRNLKIDEVTHKAVEFYIANQDTPKIKMVNALRNGVDRATETINNTMMQDLETIKVFAEIVSKLPGLIESLDKVESLVKKELTLEGKVVGSAQKGMYEDG